MQKRTTPLALAAAAAIALSFGLAPAALAGPPAALAPGADRAAETFDHFAERWMEQMRRNADTQRRSAGPAKRVTYRQPGEEFEVELRATGYPRAPYVGILRYDESLYSCSDSAGKQCGLARTTPVTELFRYQNGRWIY